VSRADVDVIAAGYQAFNHGTWESIEQNFTDDFVGRDRAELPDPQEYRGLEGARRGFFDSFRTFEEFKVEPLEYVDGDDWVLVVLRQTGRGRLSQADVTGDVVHLWRMRDGKVAGLFVYTTKEEALAAARDPGWPSS
jgi:ketosteroid isomerase-like protein